MDFNYQRFQGISEEQACLMAEEKNWLGRVTANTQSDLNRFSADFLKTEKRFKVVLGNRFKIQKIGPLFKPKQGFSNGF